MAVTDVENNDTETSDNSTTAIERVSIPTTIEKLTHVLKTEHSLTQFKFIDVSDSNPPYYDLNYEQRISLLHGTTTSQLCKSLLMKNAKYVEHNELSRTEHPQYVLVIVQYVARLHNDKLSKLVYSKISNSSQYIRKNKEYNWRLASAVENEQITGYINNAVTPFALQQPDIPIVVSDCITELDSIFLGGGHVDLKLQLNVAEYMDKCNVVVGNITYD